MEIETDKAAMTYESDSEGTLQTIAREGDTLAVGASIARVGEASEARRRATQRVGRDRDARPRLRTHPRRASRVGRGACRQPPAVAEPSPRLVPCPPECERVKASPLARRIARETGVDLGGLTGSGPGGRIVKADVEVAGSNPPATRLPRPRRRSEPSPEPAPPCRLRPSGSERSPVEDVAGAKGETTTVELSRTQRTIARRMAESKATIPDFTLTADIDMERCVALRAELKRLSRAGGGRTRPRPPTTT